MTHFPTQTWPSIIEFYEWLVNSQGASWASPMMELARSVVTEEADTQLAAHTSP